MKKKPRKPLQRKTPMKRTPMKRSKKRMNAISPKQRKILEGIRDLRAAYRDEFKTCPLTGDPVTVHEITSGWAGRAKGIVEPATWLPVAYIVNSEWFTDKVKWPVQKQLALKRRVDPDAVRPDEVQRVLHAWHGLSRRR